MYAEMMVLSFIFTFCRNNLNFTFLLQIFSDDEIINICNTGLYGGITEAYIQSPKYPDSYTPGLDCECDIHSDGADHLRISFLDLTLEMKDKTTCADWLLVQSGTSEKYKQLDLNCGTIIQVLPCFLITL